MAQSRTINTLAALFVTMTVGAIVLMLLETAPVRPPVHNLTAYSQPPAQGVESVIFNTDVPLQPVKWRNIVIHSSAGSGKTVLAGCHFVIENNPSGMGPLVLPTALWKRQHDGNHVYVPGFDYNADSIGISMIGDFSYNQPAPQQFDTLVHLIRELQRQFKIPASNVYFHSDLNSQVDSPGRAFPAGKLASQLLRAGR